MTATRMTQKNLQKHPMHPVMPSPRKEATKPKACTPHPIKPRMTKTMAKAPMIPSIVSIFSMFFNIVISSLWFRYVSEHKCP